MLYNDRLLKFGETSLDFCGFYCQDPFEKEIVQIKELLSPLKILSWQIALEDLIN